MNQNNSYTLESSKGETVSIVGCCDGDCDCTMVRLTRRRQGKRKSMEVTLPREALELIRDGIEAVLEFHDEKLLD